MTIFGLSAAAATQAAHPSDGGALLTAILVIGFALLLYFLPTLVARDRNHRSITPIFIVNLFLGWTLVFWVLTLAWAYHSPRRGARVQME